MSCPINAKENYQIFIKVKGRQIPWNPEIWTNSTSIDNDIPIKHHIYLILHYTASW